MENNLLGRNSIFFASKFSLFVLKLHSNLLKIC